MKSTPKFVLYLLAQIMFVYLDDLSFYLIKQSSRLLMSNILLGKKEAH